MKLALLIAAAFSVAVAADHLRSVLQNQLSTLTLADTAFMGSAQKFTLASVAVYFAVFAGAGVIVSVVTRRSWLAAALALLVGSASPLFTLLFGPAQPFIWATHAPRWLEILFWANWYVPSAAALLGAVLVQFVRVRMSTRAHAA